MRKYYKLEEGIADDKKKIIEDVNRDLRGFSNCTYNIRFRWAAKRYHFVKPTVAEWDRLPIKEYHDPTLKDWEAAIINKESENLGRSAQTNLEWFGEEIESGSEPD